MNHPDRRLGLTSALAAYLIWGLLPLYFQLVKEVPPFELFGWRIIFTVPVCLAMVAWRRQFAEVCRVFATPRLLGALVVSALLIGGNWLIFLAAVAENHVLATSLGYYINPLVSVLLGTVLLGERLSRLQWTAVAVAGSGVALLAAGALDTLAISLSLAFSFAFYGFVRKKVEVESIPGLTVETLVLLPLAIVIAIWYGLGPAGPSFGREAEESLALVGSGIMTAVPLVFFAVAARNLDLSALGFVQFLTPTITFVVSITLLGEALDPLRLGSFVLIWAAIALFTVDLLRKRSGQPPR